MDLKSLRTLAGYIQEFIIIILSITCLFLAVGLAIGLFMLPFGIAIYLEHLGLNSYLCFPVVLFIFCIYYITARSFKFIEGPAR